MQWAEVIGARLDEMIAAEKLTFDQVNSTLLDGEKQKELLSQDEEEDFLDEGKIGEAFDLGDVIKHLQCECPVYGELIKKFIFWSLSPFIHREVYCDFG